MPTATKRFMNIVSCTFTPTGGSPTTITGITGLSIAENAELIRASGDGDYIDTLAVVPSISPSVVIETNEPALLKAVAAGTIGSLVFTLNDARNAAVTGGGALIYTVSNAVFQPGTFAAHHRQFGTNTHTFGTFSSDGTTHPVAIAAA